MFLNQIYKTPVEKRLEKNPDLLAIRFASTNPILDPWIYILLRKAVLSKVIENIKCLFCKMGSQQSQMSFQCRDRRQVSSRDSPSDVSKELRDVSSTSQTGLYLPEVTERDPDTCQSSQRGSCSSEASNQNALKNETVKWTNIHRANSESTEQPLQMTITNECFQEKSI